MGRWGGNGKTEADNLLKVQIPFLSKHNYFQGFQSGTLSWTHGWSGTESSVGIAVSTYDENKHVRFNYTITDDNGDKRNFDYVVQLVTTPCQFGGIRYWFVCPLSVNDKYCGKRVGVLYKAGDYFGCRHCYNLTYHSNNENRRSKLYGLFAVLDAESKLDKIEQTIKRRYYDGKPTRKQRQRELIYEKMCLFGRAIEKGILGGGE